MQQPPDPLIEEALRWSVLLKSKQASDSDRAAFEQWLQADPRHEEAWIQAQQVWMRVGKIGPAFANRPPPPPPRRYHAPPPAVATRPDAPQLAADPALRGPAPAPRARRASRRHFFLTAAAMAALSVPAALVLWRPGLFADLRTGVGERRSLTLQDGSKVELAGASALSVDFTAAERRVVLQSGEAFFDVVDDAARPFVVEAADGRVRTQGGAFDIRLASGAATVVVTGRSADVSLAGQPTVNLVMGQEVRYGAGRMGDAREADMARIEAWRRDRLIYLNAPLSDVVADLERYRPGRIVMTDRSLHDIPVTGSFSTRQTDTAIDLIASTVSLDVRRLTDFLVVLSPLP